jgi:subtilisin-like proprotein convertase family protein
MRRIIGVVALLARVPALVMIGGGTIDGNPRPVCGDRDAGDCFTANGTPGCSDAACCELVCNQNQLPYCCEVGWDALCADRALRHCTLCDCAMDSECGDGRTCVDGTCAPIPTGACCHCDGTDQQFCEELTASDCVTAGGTYLGDGTGCERGHLVVESCVDEFIVSILDMISVEESFEIRDIEVQLLISHTWTGELCVSLEKENGPSVLLIERMVYDGECDIGIGGCSSDHLNITLSDDATGGSIDDQCDWYPPALTGVFIPQESQSVFEGLDSAGDWTLTVSDGTGGADIGRLHRWALRLAMPAPDQPPCSVISCACDWDLDNSGSVNIADLLDLLAQWGTDPGGPPDFDGDGDVGIEDFLNLLGHWGPCP